jgi:hypothetical protein
VDPTSAFEGHELTTDEPWLHPIWITCQNQSDHCVDPGSFHPNEAGQRAYANAVSEQIENGPGRTLYDP